MALWQFPVNTLEYNHKQKLKISCYFIILYNDYFLQLLKKGYDTINHFMNLVQPDLYTITSTK